MRTFKFIIYLFIVVAFTSCKLLNPSIMLTTGKGYNYTEFKDSTLTTEYKISPNDLINFRLFSNDGFKLVDVGSLSGSSANISSSFANPDYLVQDDGYAKLPVIGQIFLKGLSLRQAEQMLEEKYANYYVKPFVMLKIVNKRVIVFPGSPGAAKVIPLLYNNTTLIEALAFSGGISENGKAKKIKLIRNNPSDPGNPSIYLIDLSTIEGIKKGQMILQANDIIYVEPRKNIAIAVIREISPILTLLTTTLLAYTLIKQ